MKIVTFYSFKGGVGRSLSLANLAFLLSARKGQRVGLIDLDVEACGLHQILDLDVTDDRDLLTFIDPKQRDVSTIEQYVLPVSFGVEEETRAFLFPTVADSSRLDHIHWDLSARHFLRDEVFPAFERVYDLDYLLIDSRSGLSEFAVFALQVADLEILLCRPDRQNRYGMMRIVEVCRAASKPLKLVVSACPMRKYKRAVRSFEEALGAKVDAILPYDERLYFDEFLVAQRNPRSDLAKAYGVLADNVYEALNEA